MDQALDTWAFNSPVVSCSLPLARGPLDATHFCRGLLPEGEALRTLAAQADVAASATFELLERFGRDVAGALVISPGRPHDRVDAVEPYTPDSLEAAIDDLDSHPLGSHDDSELSLAGLQDKLLLVRLDDGTWGRPLHGRPSTHILKADDARRPGLVAAEALCLRLATAVGLTSFDIALETIGDTQCLIVSRFDRVIVDGVADRIHQEDLCQAMNIDHEASDGRGKYQVAGGPSFAQAATVLDQYAEHPLAELDRLVEHIVFTVLIGNADAHGKNVALLHPTPETITLAPLYDTVPTILWHKLPTRAAMWIGGQDTLPKVALSDIVAEARSWPHSARRAEQTARETIDRVVAAVEQLDEVSDARLPEYVRDRAAQVLAG